MQLQKKPKEAKTTKHLNVKFDVAPVANPEVVRSENVRLLVLENNLRENKIKIRIGKAVCVAGQRRFDST